MLSLPGKKSTQQDHDQSLGEILFQGSLYWLGVKIADQADHAADKENDAYSRIRFTVSGNGTGMSEEYLKVIFDPFTREETDETYGIQGTGLGMAITKSLVDLMSGSIKVVSKLGEGSTFKNAIGRIMGNVNKKKEKEKNDDIVRGKHILVVDDIEVNRIILVKILSTLGAVCDTACNGQEAVDQFEASQPGDYDLVLMDVQMPVLDSRLKQLE